MLRLRGLLGAGGTASAARFFDPSAAEALVQTLEWSLDGRRREEYRVRGLDQVPRYSGQRRQPMRRIEWPLASKRTLGV